MDSITFRPLARADLTMLHEWMQRPHWREWWGEPGSLAQVTAEYSAKIANPARLQPYIALLNERPFAYIQSYVAMNCGGGWWEDVTDPGVRGIDQTIADAADLGRGLGTQLVKAFVGMLFRDPAVTLVQTDPHPGNPRAIRCYEKAGFRRVAEIDTPDGRAVLMIANRRD